MKKNIIILTLLFLNVFCVKDKNPVGISDESYFSIYLTKVVEVPYDSDINKLELQSSPLISPSDISFYDFSTHNIYLKNNRNEIFRNLIDDDNTFKREETFRPFVITVKNERIYLGRLWPHNSQMGTFGPAIFDLDYFPKDVIHIFRVEPYNFLRYDTSDIRNDDRIRQGLKEASLFHAGLSVELDSVKILVNSSLSTVQYSFTIINNDQNDLYIPDPYLMGDSLFHNYTRGVVFKANGNIYWCMFRPWYITAFENWDPSWYRKLKTNESIKRTVVVKGYPYIPSGTYSCYFTYVAPTKIERNSRFRSDGRYWIGWVYSDILSVDITD